MMYTYSKLLFRTVLVSVSFTAIHTSENLLNKHKAFQDYQTRWRLDFLEQQEQVARHEIECEFYRYYQTRAIKRSLVFFVGSKKRERA